MTEKTCKQLVSGELKKEIETLKVLWEDWKNGVEDSENGNFNDHGLSFDYIAPGTFNGQRKGYFRYQISWGGPSDEFRIFAKPVDRIIKNNPYNRFENSIVTEFQVEKIEYWYLDWFDGAKRKLTGDNLALITEIFQSYFVECETAKHEYEKSMELEY